MTQISQEKRVRINAQSRERVRISEHEVACCFPTFPSQESVNATQAAVSFYR